MCHCVVSRLLGKQDPDSKDNRGDLISWYGQEFDGLFGVPFPGFAMDICCCSSFSISLENSGYGPNISGYTLLL